ncbi:MAG: MBL fold metallo-hydrolase [Alphaproteobacteria bacterium]|nr:MBL fold metallo-hydrolase [Alphaproteobacteria bacterium]
MSKPTARRLPSILADARLDRFWRRNLVSERPASLPRIDVLVISHHHCDHLHVDSLAAINRDAIVIHPDAEKLPVHSGAGMGYKAIPGSCASWAFSGSLPSSRSRRWVSAI